MTTETKSERLEDIKRIHADHLVRKDGTAAIAVTELKFLVSQAERAQELGKTNSEYFHSSKYLLEENARLLEALEEIFELSKHDGQSRYLDKCYVVACQALKGESE